MLLLIALIIFSTLYIPYIDSIPYLDGNIDFIRSYDFFNGGFSHYFLNWGSVHPPLKLFITDFLFNAFGIHAYTYNIVGFIFGIIGIIFIYKLCESIFNKKTAFLAALILATYPLSIATGIFSLTDYLVSILILISLNYYSRKNYLLHSLFVCLAVLTKETSLLIPIVVIFVEIVYSFKKIKRVFKNLKLIVSKIIYLILPLSTYYFWNIFITTNGQKAWNDWNFSDTAGKGSMYTILNNLVTFNFMNKYAYQNWKQLFLLNFNWILWLIVILGIVIFFVKDFKLIKRLFSFGGQKIKTITVIVLFSALYIFTVLSFQTYTIPRYGLPILYLLIIGVSWTIIKFINNFSQQLKILFFILASVLTVLRLFYSVDPISINLWGQTNILGQNFYALNNHLAGNDGITYNMQYNLIVKARSDQLKMAKGYVISNQCNWVFADPNNDFKTIKILKLKIDTNAPCLQNNNHE